MRVSRFGLAVLMCVAFAPLSEARTIVHASGVRGMCGGLVGIQCKAGLFCDYKPSAMCGAADQTGTCAKRTKFCAKIYKPVCGCDDNTYGNDCERKAAGVGKVKDGECG